MSDPRITDEAVEAAVEALRDRQVQRPFGRHLDHIARAALEAALPLLAPQPVDRDALAQAAHHRFCLDRGAPTHRPDEHDYDKADEILEILALLNGGAS